MYKELPSHINTIFESRPPIKVKDLSEVNIDALLSKTFTITPIATEKKLPDGNLITVTVTMNVFFVQMYI